MRYLWFLAVSAVFLVGCSKSGTESAPQANRQESTSPAIVADVVYTNGKIYTVNDTQPWVEAVAIKDGVFVAVGSSADIAAVTDEATEVVDLGGRMAMPGLVDVHNHMTGASVAKANLSLSNPNDQVAMLAEIKAFAEANPDLPYIRGEAWNMGVFPNDSPTKELLDVIVPDRPVFLLSQTGHEGWVNSKTLEMIGIDADSEQTSLLKWDVNPDTNEPTGNVREYVLGLIEQVLDPADPERLAPAIQELVSGFSANGFTSLKLAEGEIPWVQALNSLDERGDLEIRMFPSWFHRSHMASMSAEESRATAARWEEYKSDRVYPRYVKMTYDGGPNSRTVLLFDDYSDKPGFKGTTTVTPEELADDMTYFNELGLGMIVHVMGDSSAEQLVGAFEQVRERNGDNGAPLHLSHALMTQPAEIERLSKISDSCIDFIALQYPHPSITGSFVPPIGEDRYQTFLNARTAADSGVPFAFGSDWPSVLEPNLNGFFQMQAWVTRVDPSNPDSGTLNIDQALTLEQAVYGYTKGGIGCMGFDWPDKLGSIERGKLADFIVIDRNIFEIPTEELKETKVDLTIVGGEVVYSRN
jgi:predicted amidohydrolase YtcJ